MHSKGFEGDPSDIVLVSFGDADLESVAQAAMRLMFDPLDDVRVIAAQAMLDNPFASPHAIMDWIKSEPCSEARSWLILSLATRTGEAGLDFIVNFYAKNPSKLTESEDVFFNAALAICTRSRLYLLNVIKFIYSQNETVSKSAEALSRMLISENSEFEIKFLDSIVCERWSIA